jgi:hypothetical protein
MMHFINSRMKFHIPLIPLLLVSALFQVHAADDRFIQKLKLPFNLTAVVAEGDFEARSTGSFSVRLYSSTNALPGDDTTFFVSGLIRERDGSIEALKLADIDGDGTPEIVVVVRSVGTGSYLSADAFAFDQKKVWLRASVSELDKDADPIAALMKANLKVKKIISAPREMKVMVGQ